MHMHGLDSLEMFSFLMSAPANADPLPHAAVVVLLLLLLALRVIATLLRGIAPAPPGITRGGVPLRGVSLGVSSGRRIAGYEVKKTVR